MTTLFLSRKKRWIGFLVFILLAVALFFWLRPVSDHDVSQSSLPSTAPKNSVGQGGKGQRKSGPSPVQVAIAQQKAVPVYLSGLGTVQAANTVTVQSQVSGQLMALHFTEGQSVKQGDLLAEIDPRPFEVQQLQAEGQLATVQATLNNARRDLARYQSLIKNNLVSRQQLDSQTALVTQSEGNLRVAQAALANAKLQLSYSRVTAPISGQTGLKQVDVGNMISASNNQGIVVITQVQPIDVLFTLPESDIPAIQRAKRSDTFLSVEAWDRQNRTLLAEGKLLSLDNQIEITTGTLKLKARFENQDNTLFPNQFVNIRLKLTTLKEAIVIPQTAIQVSQQGTYVWTLDAEKRVHKQAITTGVVFQQDIVVQSGLEQGQTVITDGVDQLNDGMQVEVFTPTQDASGPASSGMKKNQKRKEG